MPGEDAGARWLTAYLLRKNKPARLQVGLDLQTGQIGETELSSLQRSSTGATTGRRRPILPRRSTISSEKSNFNGIVLFAPDLLAESMGGRCRARLGG